MSERRVGVFGATLVGIGGILGGGLLILLGVAFQMAGPAAILAFALNGLVAWLTAMSLAEISSAFPESGGAYTFAKKVLSVRAAFAVGWVLWFAYIVAGVLYALGFAQFAVILVRGGLEGIGVDPPAWMDGRGFMLLLATVATLGYAAGLVRKASGGGQWVTIGKVILFVLLGAAGVIALVRQPMGDITTELSPFFENGVSGVIAAMGVTFISLQGFEVVSAIAGEIREPQRTIPRAIFLSLAISFAVYMPLLLLVPTAGVDDGAHVMKLAAASPDTVVAVAAREFLGAAGYWVIVIAIVFATLSALQANLLTASRVAFAMARDHTLPSVMEQTHPTRGTPLMAIYATTLATVAITFMITDLAAAGAAAGLIFLLAFSLTHFTAYLARKRGRERDGNYRTPWFPAIPIVGGLACAALGVFQALAAPDAGAVLVMWLGLGVMLYVALFKGRAEAADASAEALDPALGQLRGRSPLVLLPIANPRTARSMVEVANALAPSEFARVLLLTIVRAPRAGTGDPLGQLADAQDAVREALTASYAAGHAPEALITAASEPWQEIRRIADEHACESLLLGLPRAADDLFERQVEGLLAEVDCDVALMRAPDDWRIGAASRVLVAVGGRGEEHELRARLLGTLCREMPREIVFATVLAESASEDDVATAVKSASRLARMKIPSTPAVEILRSNDPAAALVTASARFDLLILGLPRVQGKKMLGAVNRRIAFEAECAVMLLSRKPTTMTAVSGLARPIGDVVRVLPSLVPLRSDSDK